MIAGLVALTLTVAIAVGLYFGRGRDDDDDAPPGDDPPPPIDPFSPSGGDGAAIGLARIDYGPSRKRVQA